MQKSKQLKKTELKTNQSMKATKRIYGGVVTLRQIEINDCTDRYVGWLNDPEVNQFLETKWSVQNMDTISEFVRMQIESPDSVLFAICLNDACHENRHVGNIKIGPIHPHYNHADISYFIGEKDIWGHGVATDAINCVCKYGFQELGLHRIEAGAYACAIGSQRALEKNGFKREAVFREKVYYNDEYIDAYKYGLLREDFERLDYLL